MSEGAEAELYAKAEFCLTLGIAPSEYDLLTDAEISAFIEIYNARQT